MATQLFTVDNVKVPPVDPTQRSPRGGCYDDLTFKKVIASAADNDVLHIAWRMPPDESWLIHQMRIYQDNSEGFDNVALITRVTGRVIDLSNTSTPYFTPPSTFNKFFSTTGGGGSVTFTIESANWKQPPYFGPGERLIFQVYVNEALGWTANSVLAWQFIVSRYPEPEDIKEARKLVLPYGGWFDR